ncbi:3'-5' exoribonuclease [Embleya sp. NPDC005971]|uniref:3'-5' exoribonuclease domain-containing protein n=1 Tax=Embleya sp. NPDC005971 TaxID=3156724 RepID=UPI0033DBE112
MRVTYDTEFIEDGHNIGLISIALVAEDGREYYAVNRNMPASEIRRHPWLMDNVVPSLPQGHGDRRNHMPKHWLFDYEDSTVKRARDIAHEVRRFLTATPDLELWAWYAAFDHVALAWLWGPMSNLPDGIPMWTADIRQECARLGLTDDDMPQQEDGVHNALADARHNLVRMRFLDQVAASRP